jgi:DNA-binding GntR family transcriptional regulator
VYQQLRGLLIRHELEPGDRIGLVELAERLEVSLTPLREALTRLREEGFVLHRPNRGYFVAEATLQEAKELLEMRQALECYALTLSVPTMTDAELEKLSEAVEAYRRMLDFPDRDRFLEDKKLHLRLAAAARNQILFTTLEQILDRIIMKLRVEELPRERGPAAHAEHARVLEAVRARDVETATRLLREHLEQTKQYIVAYFTDRRVGPRDAAAFEEHGQPVDPRRAG